MDWGQGAVVLVAPREVFTCGVKFVAVIIDVIVSVHTCGSLGGGVGGGGDVLLVDGLVGVLCPCSLSLSP